MSAFDQVMRVVLDKDYDELVRLSRDALEALVPYFRDVDDDGGNGCYPFWYVVIGTIYADGSMSSKEMRFLQDVTNFSEHDICSFALLACLNDFDRRVEAVLTRIPRKYWHHALFLVAALAAVDGRVCSEESRLIRLLLD